MWVSCSDFSFLLTLGFEQDGIPMWEKRFCSLIGSVPWRKIVDAKKFMYCHSNILNWDDTAGEEAFHNAKKQFWAEMNGLYCDIRPPDPDIYIDEIDWNPVVDPELIKELDLAYIAPAEEENCKAGRKNKKTRNSASVPSSNVNDGVNPWECIIVSGTGTWESNPTGSSQWNNQINGPKNLENKDNPWEYHVAQGNGNKEVNAWGDCNKKSWGMEGNWTQNQVSQPRDWANVHNRWSSGYEASVSVKNNGWSDKTWDKSCGVDQQGSKNKERVDNTWKQGVSHQDSRASASRDGGWKNYDGVASCRKQLDNYSYHKRTFEFRRDRSGWGDWNEDSQKREDSHHNINGGYRNSWFQGDVNQTGGNHWRGNNKKRSFFPLSSR